MSRRRKSKVQWFLTMLFTLSVSGTFLYTSMEFGKKNYEEMVETIPKKSLLSLKNASTTEPYNNKEKNGKTLPRKKYVTKSMAQLGQMDEINKHFLFLNSVPKSGSEILIFLLQKIQGVNNFRHIRLKGGNKRKLTIVQQENLVYEFYEIQRNMAIPLSFDRSVYFINFTTFDKQSPTYINLIREPVAKVMSRAISKKTGTYDSYFIRCLSDSKRSCNFKNGRPYDLTIPYFCGHDPRCMLLNNEWAFETAKTNVERFFPIVGTLEEINGTLDVLEQRVPQFFRGARTVYEQHLVGIYNKKKEPQIPEEVRHLLEKTLVKEIEFYQWVKGRLLRQTKLM